MQDRVILHSDINYFYAQAECQLHPVLRTHPVVVAGKEELRHGVVLTKNPLAKRYGVKTGESLRDARLKCPGLVVIPPHYEYYMHLSKLVRKIYYEFTDKVEPFSLDEAWLDITGSMACLHMEPYEMARAIARRIKDEVGLTVSIGISWNKIFAKFGSDYKKPDAITPITRDNYQQIVWEAPVEELLYVGRATERKLARWGITTIGDLARTSDADLKDLLGKMGPTLGAFARGHDSAPVQSFNTQINDISREVKSFSNGTTFPRDIVDEYTAKAVLWTLTESVAQRLRAAHMRCKTVGVSWRDSKTLSGQSCQAQTRYPTNITQEIASLAWDLLRAHKEIGPETAMRSLHVRASQVVPIKEEQGVLFDTIDKRREREQLDQAIDDLRRRYGNNCVIWGPKLQDEIARDMDVKADNVIHPESYFHA